MTDHNPFRADDACMKGLIIIIILGVGSTSTGCSPVTGGGDVLGPRDGIYCKALAGREPADPAGRAAFAHRALWVAPSAIQADWHLVADFVRNHPTSTTQPASVATARARISAFEQRSC